MRIQPPKYVTKKQKHTQIHKMIPFNWILGSQFPFGGSHVFVCRINWLPPFQQVVVDAGGEGGPHFQHIIAGGDVAVTRLARTPALETGVREQRTEAVIPDCTIWAFLSHHQRFAVTCSGRGVTLVPGCAQRITVARATSCAKENYEGLGVKKKKQFYTLIHSHRKNIWPVKNSSSLKWRIYRWQKNLTDIYFY